MQWPALKIAPCAVTSKHENRINNFAYTYLEREDARVVINIHGVFGGVDIRVELARKYTSRRVTLRGKGGRIAELRKRHVVGARAAVFVHQPWGRWGWRA